MQIRKPISFKTEEPINSPIAPVVPTTELMSPSSSIAVENILNPSVLVKKPEITPKSSFDNTKESIIEQDLTTPIYLRTNIPSREDANCSPEHVKNMFFS